MDGLGVRDWMGWGEGFGWVGEGEVEGGFWEG